MNNIGYIKENDVYFKQNKTEIKKIKEIETDVSFKDHMKKQKKICSCFQLFESDLKRFDNFEEAKNKTGCATRCTACYKEINNLYKK